jgi:hypothetical protein
MRSTLIFHLDGVVDHSAKAEEVNKESHDVCSFFSAMLQVARVLSVGWVVPNGVESAVFVAYRRVTPRPFLFFTFTPL